MIVVFDTSALVRLASSRGGLLKLKAMANSKITIATSDYLLEELERALCKRFGSTRQRARATSRAIRKMTQIVAPESIPSRSRDPNDDPVIAAAVVAKANFLVAMDKDLLELKAVGQTQILSYHDFNQISDSIGRH